MLRRLWPIRLKPAPCLWLEPGRLAEAQPAEVRMELVEPAARWVEPFLSSVRHPACVGDRIAEVTRRALDAYLASCPRGRQAGHPSRNVYPSYSFWMYLPSGHPVPLAGTVSLRIGDDANLRRYLGHVGYGVFPPARGRRLAERAVRLLLPLARRHGMTRLWITANPDNPASRRTCERLGATLVETVRLPRSHPLYARGELAKCRYLLELD